MGPIFEKKLLFGCCALVLVFALMTEISSTPSSDPPVDFYTQQRQEMLEKIQQDTIRTSPFTGIQEIDANVMAAFKQVPRHEFVPDMLEYLSYLNRPLPIGENQTISQPFIVALMTHAITPKSGDKILEIGTGSGYQAAILSVLVKEVYTLEIIGTLANKSRQTLKEQGYKNITVVHTDGSHGLSEQAPFDKIIVTAASSHIPNALLEQLASPGKMIIPIGPQDEGQELILVDKDTHGNITQRSILPVRFVPFTGDAQNRDGQ